MELLAPNGPRKVFAQWLKMNPSQAGEPGSEDKFLSAIGFGGVLGQSRFLAEGYRATPKFVVRKIEAGELTMAPLQRVLVISDPQSNQYRG